MKHAPRAILPVLVLIASAGSGCTGTTTTVGYVAYDPYVYYSYYPADIYYSGYYWTDPYSLYYYQVIGAATGPIGAGDGGIPDGGASGSISRLLTAGDAIRALALGQEVCPNHVTVTSKTGPNVCVGNGAPGTVRNGVTIVFNGCTFGNGSQLDGTFDVQATRTASDTACNASTTVTLSNTTTITNLTYTGPGGRKLVIPTETGTSTLSYGLGQPPTSAAVTLDGHAQILAANGAVLTDDTFSGTSTVTDRQDKTSYTTDGVLTLQNQLFPIRTKLTSSGLLRSSDCCHPTGGRLKVEATGPNTSATHTLSFGPACGDATFDQSGVSLAATCL